MIDILLVDDHKILRDGIKAILKPTGEFTVAGEAENGHDAVHFCRLHQPSIVLMDLNLPGMGGLDATAEILRHTPETKVMVLSMYDDENSVIQAIRAGARAFVLKRASYDDLLDALRTVARGGFYLSPQVSGRLLHRIQRGHGDEQPAATPLDHLSPREVQVMRMVADGKTSKEIAVMLELGVHTVRSYRKTLMKKLGISNVAGLTQLALSTGLSRPVDTQQTQTAGAGK